MKSNGQASYTPAPANDLLYVQMKLEWKAANRGATPEQYDAAIELMKAVCNI